MRSLYNQKSVLIIAVDIIPIGPKKRHELCMALCNRVGKMNQQKSMFVMSKHL